MINLNYDQTITNMSAASNLSSVEKTKPSSSLGIGGRGDSSRREAVDLGLSVSLIKTASFNIKKTSNFLNNKWKQTSD